MRDRLSFRRFCGIPLDEETPDHSSIWRFRQRIEKLGLSEKLLAEVNRQLDARGLIVKRGTLVDATIIAAAVKPPSFEEGRSASAIPTRASRSRTTRPTSATRRIWRWTRRAALCAKRR